MAPQTRRSAIQGRSQSSPLVSRSFESLLQRCCSWQTLPALWGHEQGAGAHDVLSVHDNRHDDPDEQAQANGNGDRTGEGDEPQEASRRDDGLKFFQTALAT